MENSNLRELLGHTDNTFTLSLILPATAVITEPKYEDISIPEYFFTSVQFQRLPERESSNSRLQFLPIGWKKKI